MTRTGRWVFVFFAVLAYVAAAFAVDSLIPDEPVLATLVFQTLVAAAFWPGGVVDRRADVGRPRFEHREGLVVLLWLCFWVGTQATVTVLAASGVDVGVYGELSRGESACYVVLTALVAPVAEEFFFRWFLFGHLRRLFPFWAAVGTQAVLFAWAHGSGVHLYVGVVSGAAFALLCEWTGSVWTSVRFHAVYNVLCLVAGTARVPTLVFRPEFVLSFNFLVVALFLVAGEGLRARRLRAGRGT